MEDAAYLRVKALALDDVTNATRIHLHHGHLALSQGAGLVAADDGSGPQRLNRRKLANKHVLLDHITAADGQGDGHTKRDALGNGGNSERHRDQDHVQPRGARQVRGVPPVHGDTNDKDHDANNDRQDTNAGSKAFQVHLQRRSVRRRVRQAPAFFLALAAICICNELSNSANARVHTCLHDDALAFAVLDAATREDHVLGRELLGLALPPRLVLPCLCNIIRFACERHLTDLDVVRLCEPKVCGDNIAGAKHDDVTSHDRRDLDLDLLAAAHNIDGGLRHLRKRLQRIAGLVLRPRGDAGIDEDDDKDCHTSGVGEDVMLLRSVAVHHDGGNSCAQQQHDDKASQLHDKEHQQRRLGWLFQLVGTILSKNLGSSLGREAIGYASAYTPLQLLQRHLRGINGRSICCRCRGHD
mmetsp:Transcript_57018/g.144754  ORF Transcript_57018/g.144754 Transcript_57018/m.144754 type:complete len:413 (+) Transcript_57018:2242-3480(+)